MSVYRIELCWDFEISTSLILCLSQANSLLDPLYDTGLVHVFEFSQGLLTFCCLVTLSQLLRAYKWQVLILYPSQTPHG